MPPGAVSLEPGPARIELAARDVSPAGPGRDLILVIGGPYELTSECPELGCLAWIMDRRVRSTMPGRWIEPNPGVSWGGRAAFPNDDVYPSSLHLTTTAIFSSPTTSGTRIPTV